MDYELRIWSWNDTFVNYKNDFDLVITHITCFLSHTYLKCYSNLANIVNDLHYTNCFHIPEYMWTSYINLIFSMVSFPIIFCL